MANALSMIANPLAGVTPFGQAFEQGRANVLRERATQAALEQQQREFALKQQMFQSEQAQLQQQQQRKKDLENLKRGVIFTQLSMNQPEDMERKYMDEVYRITDDPVLEETLNNIMSIPNGPARDQQKQLLLNRVFESGIVPGITSADREKATADVMKTLTEAKYKSYTSEMKNAEAITNLPIDDPLTRSWVQRLAEKKENEVNITLPGKDIDTYTENLSKNLGKRETEMWQSTQEEAKSAKALEAKLNEFSAGLDRIVKAGGQTGPTTEFFTDVKAFGKKFFGLNFEGLSDEELLRNISSELALRLRNPESGLGLTGNTSDRDLSFLLSAVPGLSRSVEGNKLILNLMKSMTHYQQKRAGQWNKLTNDVVTGKLKGTTVSAAMQNWLDQTPILTRAEIDAVNSTLQQTGQSIDPGYAANQLSGQERLPQQDQVVLPPIDYNDLR